MRWLKIDSKINIEKTIDVIDKLFAKGDKRRGDAMVVAGIARIEGREEMKKIILKMVERDVD